MIKIDDKEIITGQGPETGVILSADEFAELDAAREEMLRQAKEAEAASKEAEEQLEALKQEKSAKNAYISELQAKLEKLENTMDDLNVMLDQEERLNAVLMKIKEGAK